MAFDLGLLSDCPQRRDDAGHLPFQVGERVPAVVQLTGPAHGFQPAGDGYGGFRPE